MSSSSDHDGTVEIDIAVTLSLFLLTISCCYLVTRTLIQVCPVILKKVYQGCYLLPLVTLVVVGTIMACFTTILVVFLIAPQSTLHQKKPKILYVPSSTANSPSKHKHIKCAPTTPSPYFTSLLPIGGTNPMSNPVMGPWSNKIHPEEGGSGGGVQKLSTIVVEGGLTTKTNPLGPFDPIPGPSVPSSIVATTAIRTGQGKDPASAIATTTAVMATAYAEPLSLAQPAFSEGIDISRHHHHHHRTSRSSNFFGIKIP